jgi:hypothetical protein
MGNVAISLGQVVTDLADAFRSVDIRIAAFSPGTSPTPPTWIPLQTVIRISPRHPDIVGLTSSDLVRRLGTARTEHFAIFRAVASFAEIPPLPPRHQFLPKITSAGLHLEAIPLKTGDLLARVERFRHKCEPVNEEAWPVIEYSYLPDPALPATTIDTLALDAEVRRDLGFTSFETALRAHLQVRDASAHYGNVLVVVEMPASITSIRLDGTLLALEATVTKSLGDVRCFVTKRRADGIVLLDHRAVALVGQITNADFTVLHGSIELDANPDELLEVALTHSRVPELDETHRIVRDLMPLSERNPLLVCLSKFWDLSELRQRIDRPYETPRKNLQLNPQMAFQASIASLLSLAGFQTIDLGRADQMRHPITNVNMATADLLAYHAAQQLLLVGACTINVPRGADYEGLLQATSLLRQQFSDRSRINLISVLFTGQEGDSALTENALVRRVRILTRDELTQAWHLVETGHQQRLLTFLLGLTSL